MRTTAGMSITAKVSMPSASATAATSRAADAHVSVADRSRPAIARPVVGHPAETEPARGVDDGTGGAPMLGVVAERGEFVPTARPGVVGVQGSAADVQIDLGGHEPMLTGTSHPGVNIASSANTLACNEKLATDNLARQNKIAADLSARQRSVVLPAGRARAADREC